jgi:proteasome accessory factor B
LLIALENPKYETAIPKAAEVRRRIAAQLVRERNWHPSRRITELKGGRLELSLVLGGFEEIERWLLSWGEHAQVVSPPELISQLKATINKCLAYYQP